jgi:hypothetical protein
MCPGVVRPIVARPSMCSVWPEPWNDSGQNLAITVRDEVVGVAVCDSLVVLLHQHTVDVVHSHLEQGDFPGGLNNSFSFGQSLVVREHQRMVLHRRARDDTCRKSHSLQF